MISLKKVSNTLWDKKVLKDITWSTEFGQNWAIIGPNGAGKSILIKIILGHLPYSGNILRHAKISNPEKIANVSFDQQKLIYIQEWNKLRYENFSGKKEKILSGINFLDPRNLNNNKIQIVAKKLNISKILEKPLSQFSNGEFRKILIARAIVSDPELIILDEPFDGLDNYSVELIKEIISELINSGLTIWLVSHRFDEIIPEISHILCLKSGKIFAQGLRSNILTYNKIKNLFKGNNLKFLDKKIDLQSKVLKNKNLLQNNLKSSSVKDLKCNNIIEMVNVNISYGEKAVLKNFNWTVKKEENWKILGPNGAGKSTIISLIFGQNLQVYSNEIYIFGIRRGSGESIWDIKKNIGLVSPEFQLNYREPISSKKVVLSGFYDSIGYFKQSSEKQKLSASKWMEFLKISDLEEENFTRLSYGQQRLILIARAMVKNPSLLLLDEPCQGLDLSNRKNILNIIDEIARNSKTQIIYISHFSNDQLKCLKRELRFEFLSEGSFKPRIL